MKNIFIACLLVVIAATSSFGAASAAVSFTDAGKNVVANATGGTAIGRLSVNDALGFLITPDATNAVGISYVLFTQHAQGTRTYGTASDGTAIYWVPATKGSGHVVPGAGNVSEFATGWTVM